MIVLVFLAALGGAAWVLVVRYGDVALARGHALYPHRALLERIDSAAADAPPAVVWLGDSTLMDIPGVPSLPLVIDRTHLWPANLSSLNLYAPGLDLFAYYGFMGRVLELRPRVVVLVANLRIFLPGGGARGFTDLAGLVPPAELPAALALPLGARGLSIPRLLLARLLARPWGESSFFFAEGVRRLFQDAAFWSALGSDQPPRRWFGGLHTTLVSYNLPISKRHPLVRFAGAAVRMAEQRGVETLVVVTPVPYQWLTAAGGYDRRAFALRIDALRRAVEANGGTLIDRHRALPYHEFRDQSGHFTASGTEQVAAVVWPTLSALLRGR